MNTKTKQLSRDAANARCAALDMETTALRCALQDCLNGNVKWFGNSRAYQIGVARADSASGGIAIVRAGGSVIACDYMDRYCGAELMTIAHCITGQTSEYQTELLCRREAIEAAIAYRNDALKAA